MRDDVKQLVAELTQRYKDKLKSLNKLLLNESDKFHYIHSQNLEQLFELVEADKGIIEEIDAIDCDISQAENAISKIIGVNRQDIFTYLGSPEERSSEIASLRKEIKETAGALYDKRTLLIEKMKKESAVLDSSINEISRISKLKIP